MKHNEINLRMGTAYVQFDATDKCLRYGRRPIFSKAGVSWEHSFHAEIWFDEDLHDRIEKAGALRLSDPEKYYTEILPHYNEIVYGRPDADRCPDCGQLWWGYNHSKCT